MCVEINTEGPLLACRTMYLWYIMIQLLPSMKEMFHFKGRLIDDVLGFSSIPAAGEEILYVSLVSSQIAEVCHPSTLLQVSWQMCHAWITYGKVSGTTLTVSRLNYTWINLLRATESHLTDEAHAMNVHMILTNANPF